MKKIFVIILIMSFAYSYGQSIKLFYNDNVVGTDTITINVRGSADYHLDIVNTSTQDINLMIRREIISLVDSAETYFCFTDCYADFVDALPQPYLFRAGDTCSVNNNNDTMPYFYVHYDPQNQKGISIIKFDFFNNNAPTDVSSVVFKFDSYTLSIAENQIAQVSLNAYPNPATTKVFIQHDLKNQASEAKLLVSNLMGATVKSIPISSTSNKTQIDVSDLASGIYFYSIVVGGKISVTKKLIVK